MLDRDGTRDGCTAARDGLPTDPRALQSCIRDLVTLLALPALSNGRDPRGVVQVLVDVMLSVVRLEVAYAQLNPHADQPLVEVARADGCADAADRTAEFRAALEACLTEGVAAPVAVRHPLKTAALRAVCLPFDVDGSAGALVAAAARADFPTVTEALLLRVGVNQAAIAVRGARLFATTQAARAEAETANRAKDEFLATVSHELRTPLNAILGWARMLRAGMLPEAKRQRALEAIERNAHAQAQLIEDVLDVSRIVTGKLRLSPRAVEMPRLVEAAVDTVRPAADAKGVRLDVVLDDDVGVAVGDPDRLQQVVWNLLSNAVKFTPGGGRVTVRLRRRGDQIELSVEDTGQGIPPEFLPHVFERFRQADGSLSRAHGGLGLGLAIAKHLVELHGGRIEARSEGAGRGASFFVCLAAGAHATCEHAGPATEPR